MDMPEPRPPEPSVISSLAKKKDRKAGGDGERVKIPLLCGHQGGMCVSVSVCECGSACGSVNVRVCECESE